jgi:hypothetical protein
LSDCSVEHWRQVAWLFPENANNSRERIYR